MRIGPGLPARFTAGWVRKAWQVPVALAEQRASLMDGRRPGVAGPQLDHLDCYRDEPCSGDDAHDDVTGEDGYRHAEGYSDAGKDSYQQPVAGQIWCGHRCLASLYSAPGVFQAQP